MSGTFWIKELAEIIKSIDGTFDSPLLHMSNEESLAYIKEEVAKIDLSKFMSAVSFEETELSV